jgi:Zn-dependent alcohol dehydrogenase
VSTHYAFLLSGRTLKGSMFGGWKPKSDLPSLVDKYAAKVFMILLQKQMFENKIRLTVLIVEVYKWIDCLLPPA